MTSSSGTPKNIMLPLGGLILLLVVAYYLFFALDTVGLTDQVAPAIVVSKNYRAAGTTYTTQIVNSRSYVTPQATPEAYMLELQLDEHKVEAAVPKDFFDSVNNQDQVTATYQIRRLTGEVQITDVNP